MSNASASRMARWLLGKYRWASLGIIFACWLPAVLLRGPAWWMLITFWASVLAGGFVQWRSRGLVSWSERLPANPGLVWGAQLIWVVTLALPATLTTGWLSRDPGLEWWHVVRCVAWLICLGSASLVPYRLGARLPFVVGLALWLVSTELRLELGAATVVGAVFHDVALAAVTTAYVLAIARRVPDDPSGTGVLFFAFLLLFAGRQPEIGAVSWIGLAVFGWLALTRLGLMPRLVAGCGLALATAFGPVLMAVGTLPFWFLLYRLLTNWGGSMATARSELGDLLGEGPWITSGRLIGIAIFFWAVIVLVCEARRLRVVERWMRRRDFLERMPLTRKQFLAQAFLPQLRIARDHFMMVVAVGLATTVAFRAFELEGVVQVWRWGGSICAGGVAYLLAAQIFIARRGLAVILSWIAIFGLPMIVYRSLIQEVFWLTTAAATILVMAGVAAIRMSPLNPVPDPLKKIRADIERFRADYEKARADLEKGQAGHRAV